MESLPCVTVIHYPRLTRPGPSSTAASRSYDRQHCERFCCCYFSADELFELGFSATS
jgi:hypothetical protein